jgi:hypothetical protein
VGRCKTDTSDRPACTAVRRIGLTFFGGGLRTHIVYTNESGMADLRC